MVDISCNLDWLNPGNNEQVSNQFCRINKTYEQNFIIGDARLSDEQYNSTLSRNRFLFPETKIVAKLKPEGLNDSTIVKTLSYKDSNSFFQQLKEKQDELISWVAAIGPVRGFFQNQVDKFDEGRQKLEY